ncbi:MAG: hypothetical protein E6I80_09175 [Chloroflexi bacterium]|nr:MAG: hypothetical protein E6I80_09175 [Chloroflexota bacterium]
MTVSNSGRDYWAIWKQFVLQGVMQEDVLPPALVQSWRRCAAQGLDPYGASSSIGREDMRELRTNRDQEQLSAAADMHYSIPKRE